jgi:hypothetical protein
MSAQKAKVTDNEQQARTGQQLIKAGTTHVAADGKAAGAATAKPKLNPKDFMFMQLTGQTHVKLPG